MNKRKVCALGMAFMLAGCSVLIAKLFEYES